MSLLKHFLRFTSVVAVIVSAPVIRAHDSHPFIDPLEFNPDWQWFAPVDAMSLTELSPKKRANVGWFASHDRTYIWLSRPDNGATGQFSTTGSGDFIWGHRTDIGFMKDTGTGWMMNFRRFNTFSGCGIYETTLVERINRFNADDEGDFSFFPFPDRNDRFLGGRFYELQNSLNVATLNNLELNKVWRKSPYRYGGILEPFGGLRYTSFNDVAQDQDYFRSTDNINEPGAVDTETQLETLLTDRTTTLNRMIGGQLGARYFTHYHRWRVGGEFRAFLAGNFQTNSNVFTTDLTYYDGGPGEGVDVSSTFRESNFTTRTNQTTVWGYEVRADAAYQLTRYISARGGVEVLEFGRGIWRGGTSFRGNTTSTNQGVFMAGVTFGVELNR